MAFLDAVQVPTRDQLLVQLQRLVQQGELTPIQAEAALQEASAFEGIQGDPRLRQSQLGALSGFERMVSEGGLDARGRADIEEALSAQRTETRGAQDAILADTRRRGIGGSDIETVSRLTANQGAAQRGNANALQVGALREQRRSDALRDVANLSGSIRGQDFSEDARRAEAADAINRFNTANRQQTNLDNAAQRRVTQAQNLSERQRVADTNVGIANQQETTNRRVPLDIFNAQADIASARDRRNAEEDARDDARRSSTASTIGSVVGAAALALSDERQKEDVQPVDSRRVLEDLSGYTFEYRDPAMGEGEQMGVMAQDMERTPMAGMVEETPMGKAIDYGEMGFESGEEGGRVMALLSDINKRLMALEGGGRA